MPAQMSTSGPRVSDLRSIHASSDAETLSVESVQSFGLPRRRNPQTRADSALSRRHSGPAFAATVASRCGRNPSPKLAENLNAALPEHKLGGVTRGDLTLFTELVHGFF